MPCRQDAQKGLGSQMVSAYRVSVKLLACGLSLLIVGCLLLSCTNKPEAERACDRYVPGTLLSKSSTAEEMQSIGPKGPTLLAGYSASVKVALCLRPGFGGYEVVGVTLSDNKSHVLWSQNIRREITPPS